MSMNQMKQIDLNLLPIETLGEMANDKAEQVEKNAKKTVSDAIDCGRYLTAIKEQMEHGEWLPWLGANFNYSRMTASRYMSIAANVTSMNHLLDAKDINEALRMIADSKPETAPRSERKSGQVEVLEPDAEPDDDPTPDPPTIRKTAKGSEKVKEADKPKTAAITPEIIDEPKETFPEETTLSDFSEQQILDFLVATADEPKPRAKRLRKVADKLDPPTKFVKPDLDDVVELMRAYSSTKEFIEKHGKRSDIEIATAVEDFMDHYNGNGWVTGNAKAPMKDWRATAQKWIRNQSQFVNGKVNSNGSAHRGTGRRGLTAEEVFSAESLGRGR